MSPKKWRFEFFHQAKASTFKMSMIRLKLKTLCSSNHEILIKFDEVPFVKLIHVCLTDQQNEIEIISGLSHRLKQPFDIRQSYLQFFKPSGGFFPISLKMC